VADTIREVIIQAIKDRLTLIRSINGYNTEIGKKIFRCRRTLDPSDDLPCTVIWPNPDESVEYRYGEVYATMPIRLEAQHAFDTDEASEEAEKCLGDLIMAMTSSDPTDGQADDVSYQGGGVNDYPDDGMRIVGVYALFNIKYHYEIGNPYP